MHSDPDKNRGRGAGPVRALLTALLAVQWLLSTSMSASAEIRVRDSLGADVVLAGPAQRVVALAPHIVENLFIAGAGDRVVGAVGYSNYPAAAKAIPRVGSYSNFSVEAIAALKPDLVIGWSTGHRDFGSVRRQLQALGIPVYVDEPRRLADVATSLRVYGQLTGSGAVANAEARAFEEQLQALRRVNQGQDAVTVFYQIWHRPLQTLNGEHIVSDLIELCGGVNVFADAETLAPRISVEAVLARDPEVIIASGMAASRPEWLDDWRGWSSLRAVRGSHLYFIPPDWLQRHTPRLLRGAEMMCEQLRGVRAQRDR